MSTWDDPDERARPSGFGGDWRGSRPVFDDPMSWSLPIMRVARISVRVHLFFLVFVVVLLTHAASVTSDGAVGVRPTLLGLAGLFLVVLLHEFGHCIACRAGKTNCCMSLKVLGVHIDGGMCEYLAVPETNLFKAEGITLDEAAMVEFLAIGAHAVARAKVSRGERALVVGSGPIGVGVAIFAGLAGAEVTVIDSRADRLNFATQHLAVPQAIMLGEGDAGQMQTLTGGEFYTHVFDCTGSPKAMERGFTLVAHGGTYVLVSIVQGNISFSDPEFHKREMTLLSSRNATLTDFATVMTAMRNGHVPTRVIKTHSAPLWEVASKMPEWITPEAGTVKAVLEL